MSVNGTLVEDKMRRFKGECEHFRFNKCPIYTHDGASAKLSTNSQEKDNSEHIQYKKTDLRLCKFIVTINMKHGLFCQFLRTMVQGSV